MNKKNIILDILILEKLFMKTKNIIKTFPAHIAYTNKFKITSYNYKLFPKLNLLDK